MGHSGLGGLLTSHRGLLWPTPPGPARTAPGSPRPHAAATKTLGATHHALSKNSFGKDEEENRRKPGSLGTYDFHQEKKPEPEPTCRAHHIKLNKTRRAKKTATLAHSASRYPGLRLLLSPKPPHEY
ncbi:hypothetical protein E2C01_020578 [Portunus trituberculatus]|uniref:Uncharacterized protein n=1 Tax=Portunus trituberculatus TaxID=210409 RepID=A0A5B7E0V4_PORTR|nr:hypothetical protein [Portunus trituberculatus]